MIEKKLKDLVEKRIKERFGKKGEFCAKCEHPPKELSKIFNTLSNKLKWLDTFLAPLGLGVTVGDDVPYTTAEGVVKGVNTESLVPGVLSPDDRDDLIGEERPHFDFSEDDKSLHIKNFGTLEPGVKVRVYDTKFSKKPPGDVDRNSYYEGVITGATSEDFSYYSVLFKYKVTKAVIVGQDVTSAEERSFSICRDLSALRYVQIL